MTKATTFMLKDACVLWGAKIHEGKVEVKDNVFCKERGEDKTETESKTQIQT